MNEQSAGYKLNVSPPPSGWRCYLLGTKPGVSEIVFTPAEGQVPNAFVRWMMKVCFACTWVKGE